VLGEGMEFINRLNPNFKWNMFDSVVVGSTLLEVLGSLVALGIPPNVSALRMLRTMRLMRVFRVIRVMRFSRICV